MCTLLPHHYQACHAFLTTSEAIAVGIAAAVIFIIALILTAGCIVAAQNKLEKAAEEVEENWIFKVNEKGLGYWSNKVKNKISLSLPEDCTHPPNDKWIQVLNVDQETVGYFNTDTAHLVCEMVKDVVPDETPFELPNSCDATSPNAHHIWEGAWFIGVC